MRDFPVDILVWKLSRRVNSRLTVDEISVVAYRGVLTESRSIGASVSEHVPVIVARVIHFAIRFDISVKSHRPVVTGETRFNGWRSGILRGRTIVIESYSLDIYSHLLVIEIILRIYELI